MTETANGTIVPREKEGERDEAESRKREGEVSETEDGYKDAMRAKEEERWREDGWISNWKRDQPDKNWTEKEVREEHKRDREDRVKSWWGGTELDREEDFQENEMKARSIGLRIHAERGLTGSTGPLSTLTIGGHRST